MVDVSIGAPGWTVVGATLQETLNEPFRLRVELASEAELDATLLLGSSQELVLRRAASEQRVSGIVTAVHHRDDRRWQSLAEVTIEPALAALHHRRDSRIFQQMSVPDILARVLGEDLRPFGREVRQALARTYPPREYTVQYRETDFDFVHRLMEEEGIVYFFAHEGAAEVMTLVDRNAAHPTLDGPTEHVLMYEERAQIVQPDHVWAFEQVARVTGTRVSTRHFDWTHPSMPVEAQRGDAKANHLESYVHDAPVTYHSFSHAYGAHNANDQAQLYRELQLRDGRMPEGRSSALGVRAGHRFDLAGHPRLELNAEYLIVSVEHRLLAHAEDELAQDTYRNRFTCVPVDVQWRPARTHARPRMSSIQTATVVGPAGEEIHTDPHGRVKVQFHWDRLGTRDDASSCWIRVAQAMGGAGWGFSFIPRIGMEVIVAFVEGDPDQPLVTGVVYNTENPPPYDFPAQKTRTTMKSNSSPGGGGYNELRFEDAAGSEEIFLHGQKDWNTVIEHDLNRRVGHDETLTVAENRMRVVGMHERVQIGLDRTHQIGVNETQIVGANRTRNVGSNETLTVGANRTRNVGGNEAVAIAGKATTRVGGNASSTVGGKRSEKVGKSVSQTIGKSFTQSVGLTHTVNVGALAMLNVVGAYITKVGLHYSLEVGLNASQKVGGNFTQRIKGNHKQTVNGAVSITAGESFEIVCGSSKLVLESGGKVTIHGTAFEFVSSGPVKIEGSIIDLN